MRQLHTFDEVFDSQRMFRSILDAMANPGRRCSIERESEKMYGENPEMLATAMTLLDAGISFHTADCTELDEQILLLTHAKQKAIEEADFIFVPESGYLEEAVTGAKSGTLENPHASATIIIKIPEGEEERNIRLLGPGINGSIRVQVSKSVVRTLKLRDEQEYEYPQGIDLIFLLPGKDVMCIPRLVKMEEV